MRYPILFACLLFVGCSQPIPSPVESTHLVDLKNRLSGVHRSVSSQSDLLKDNTEILRQIRDAVVLQVAPESDSEFTDVEGQPVEFTHVELEIAPPPPESAQILIIPEDDKTDAELDPVARGEVVRIDVPDEQIQAILQSDQVQAIVANAGRDAYVVKWTASWCGPCGQWDREQRAKLEAAGIKVVELDIDANPGQARRFKVASVPAFSLCRRSTEQLLSGDLLGYTSAETIISRIDQLLQKASTPTATAAATRMTQRQLTQWIRIHYTRSSQLIADVADHSDVWRHLTDHGFTASQVNGLSQWDALCLHDAVHQGKVGPWL